MVSWRDTHANGQTVRRTLSLSLSACRRLSSLAGRAADVLRYLRTEYDDWNRYPVPLWRRLSAWRHGFMSRDYVLLELDRNDCRDYLSSLQQAKYISPAINQEYADVLENKVAYHLSTNPYLDAVPEFYGVVRDGEFSHHSTDGRGLLDVLDEEGDLIVKPATGTHGRRVYHLSTTPNGYRLNGESTDEAAIRDVLGDLDGFVVVEYVRNHEYARSICPTSVNTIRVLTVRDPDTREFFVASAVHRFGNDSTGPTDNWSGGGFAAPVDVDTGELGWLHTYSPEAGLRRLERHPSTETRVAGETVPRWDEVKSTVLEAAAHHRENPYVGWDVVLTDDGPKIIEGNCAPHLALQQLGSGLLEDDRVRRFLDDL
jgi:hypothetical protein